MTTGRSPEPAAGSLVWPAHPACSVELVAGTEAVRRRLAFIFDGHLGGAAGTMPIVLRCRLVDRLDHPTGELIFTEPASPHGGDFGRLFVYQADEQRLILRFDGGAAAAVSLAPDHPAVDLQVTPEMVHGSRFEDAVFTSLAPLLRRRGLYLVHAFAAVSPAGGATLLIGPSGSGKTTTGLNLLLHGWRLLANDVALLKWEDGVVWALPTPGVVSIRAKTFELLPDLRRLTGGSPDREISVSGRRINRWGRPAPVSRLIFPAVGPGPDSALLPESRSVALARILEESLDRWDGSQIAPHTSLLAELVEQTTPNRLHLGRDFDRLPDLLA